MDVDVDHYAILGLPSGEEGGRLSEQEINKAYKAKAMKVHPDKNRDDPNAHASFLKLQTSYEVLKDESTRKLFDDLLRVKREKIHRQGHQDSKRRKMMSDLEERERSAFAFAFDPDARAREEEERISRKLNEEISKIRAMYGRKMPSTPFKKDAEAKQRNNTGSGGNELDKTKMLKVSWEKVGEGYTAQGLMDIFEKFGTVEDIVIKTSKKKGSALVVMASKDEAASVLGNVLGNLSNPLLVLPLQPVSTPPVFNPERSEPDGPKLRTVVGAGIKAFENSVIEKMRRKAAETKTSNATEAQTSNAAET